AACASKPHATAAAPASTIAIAFISCSLWSKLGRRILPQSTAPISLEWSPLFIRELALELAEIRDWRQASNAAAHPCVDRTGGLRRRGRLVERSGQAVDVPGDAYYQGCRAITPRKRALPMHYSRALATQDDELEGGEILLQGGGETDESARLALHRRVVELHRALGSGEVSRFPHQVPQPLQGEGGDAIAGRRGTVLAGFGAVYQVLMVVRYEEKAAFLAVFEPVEEDLREVSGERQIPRLEFGLQQLEQRFQQQRVIVEVGVQVRNPILVRREKPPLAPKIRAQKIDGTARGFEPAGLAKNARGPRQALYHHRVPARQHLLAPPRAHAPFPGREELAARGGQPGRALRRRNGEGFRNSSKRLHHPKMPLLSFEVGCALQSLLPLPAPLPFLP